jgi:KDO2-lipid IV(A) lauroyltransferase
MSALVFALMRLAHYLPLPLLALLGNTVGAAVYWLIPERRRVARVNLEKCFPALDARARERLVRAHFRAFGRAFLERSVLWWAPRKRIERLVRVEGLERLRALRGAPAILLIPHFVGLDAGVTRLSCEIDYVAMYARQKDPRFEALLAHGRRRFGDQLLVSRQQGVRALLAAMRRGRPLYYLPDLDFGARDALFVPFFGVPAATVSGLSRIARLAGARVLPCVTRMLPGGAGYEVAILPAWDNFPTDDVATDTRRMNAFIEERVREMPEQYYWLHKRFKTRPPGEARFYD